jgi:hypothetical protein
VYNLIIIKQGFKMKNCNYLKIMFIISIIAISAEGGAELSSQEKLDFNMPILSNRLPAPRELIPHSLKGRISNTTRKISTHKGTNTECNENSLCASFDTNTTPADVSSWMGFDFKDTTGKYFIATYGQKANHLGNNVYATEKWDKRHFWINIGENTVPFPIQPRFVGIDEESGNEWFTVDYLGYQKSGINYANYSENMSMSSLILLINPTTKKVEKYHLEYYDENDQYVEDYTLNIGDKIESYFLGFKKGEDDTDYLFFIEDITTITSPITFTYKEQYPGKDFNCTHCEDLDLSSVEFKYIFESFDKNRSNFTEPQPLIEKSTSTTKSVSLFGTWILLFLSIFIAMRTL